MFLVLAGQVVCISFAIIILVLPRAPATVCTSRTSSRCTFRPIPFLGACLTTKHAIRHCRPGLCPPKTECMSASALIRLNHTSSLLPAHAQPLLADTLPILPWSRLLIPFSSSVSHGRHSCILHRQQRLDVTATTRSRLLQSP